MGFGQFEQLSLGNLSKEDNVIPNLVLHRPAQVPQCMVTNHVIALYLYYA